MCNVQRLRALSVIPLSALASPTWMPKCTRISGSKIQSLARELYEGCRAIQGRCLGEGHPSLATTYHNIGSVLKYEARSMNAALLVRIFVGDW